MIERKVLAVTFDVTGTLIHSPRLGEIYSAVLARHGTAVDGHEVGRVVRLVWQEFQCAQRLGEDRFGRHPGGARGWWGRFLERVCEQMEASPPSRFAQAELFDRFGSPEAWEVYPEVPATLDRLARQGLRLGVISNWDERLPVLLERLGLARRFDVIAYSAAVGSEKPFPAIFRHALARLGVAAESALHVGDRPTDDVEGADGVGMPALHLDRSGAAGDLAELSPLARVCVRADLPREVRGET